MTGRSDQEARPVFDDDTPALLATFITVGARLFHERGYSEVSVEEIVRAAGVTKGAFYYYLESKSDLLYRIHDLFISRELAEAEAIRQRKEPADMRLRRLVESLVTSIDAYLPYVTVFFNEVHHLEEPYLTRIREKRDRYFAVFRATIEEGMAQGRLRADLDPTIVTMGVFGMCNWMHKWYRPDGPLPASAIAEQFLALLLGGLSPAS